MTISALVVADSPLRLWGLEGRERLRRQLREIGDVNWPAAGTEPRGGTVLLLDGRYLFETRTLRALLGHPGAVLFCARDGRPAAAYVTADRADAAKALLASGAAALPEGLVALAPGDFAAFDEQLRSAREPALEPVTAERLEALENLLYGNAYRGITDCVTKFLWPRPARRAVRLCARLGLSPNTVTVTGLLLMLAACVLFWQGRYFAGLAAGWLMTFLDTVDGKLARVTVQSSQFGHLLDHAIDLVHPPFWYIFWGASLAGFEPVLGLDFTALCWLLVVAYVGGRIAEGLFHLLGSCSLFTWRPFDAWFRLVTARRNPCLLILTASALAGRPAEGFIAVVGWSALSSGVLWLRLAQGAVARLRRGPLRSWLQDSATARTRHARSFHLFGGTQGAFAA